MTEIITYELITGGYQLEVKVGKYYYGYTNKSEKKVLELTDLFMKDRKKALKKMERFAEVVET